VPHFVVERPVGIQLFGHLWACLTLHLKEGTTPETGEHASALAPRSPAEDRQRVLAALQECSPLDRAVWLFAAVTGLSMESLAELTGRPELAIRHAHARVSWVVHNALLE
jgi:DNA-directed RNA polymerase specialized sigma24 family protein